MSSNIKSFFKLFLIAAFVGTLVGLLFGGVLPLLGIRLPDSATTAGVGLAIGITIVLLNNRKE